MKFKFFLLLALSSLLAFFIGRYSSVSAIENHSLAVQAPKNALSDLSFDDNAKRDEHSQYAMKQDCANESEESSSSHNEVASSNIEMDSASLLLSLKSENKTLQEKLEKQRQDFASQRAELVNKYVNAKQDYMEAKSVLDKNGLAVNKVAIEELQATLPDIFAKNLVFSSELANHAKNHANEEQDFDWGHEMQQRISDFFITHPLANTIIIDSISCKTKTCEIRGFETQDGSYKAIADDLLKEAWWNAMGSGASTYGIPTERGKMFYQIREKSYGVAF